jgi:hypothetical protein
MDAYANLSNMKSLILAVQIENQPKLIILRIKLSIQYIIIQNIFWCNAAEHITSRLFVVIRHFCPYTVVRDCRNSIKRRTRAGKEKKKKSYKLVDVPI